MKIIVISALVMIVVMMGAQSAYAAKPYWTASDKVIPSNMKAYHVFLDGIYPSHVARNIRLLNQNLSACIDFTSGTNSNVNPTLCHQIKQSDIPKAKDSILDAGFFVVSDKLNETAAMACISIGYHNWGVFCNGQTIDANSFYSNPKLLEDLGPTYDDVLVNDACLTYHHLKEGTPEFHDCENGLS